MKDPLARLIYAFAALKLVIHGLLSTNYGLHRDAYLYLDHGRHLAWGFMEGPPGISWIAWVAHQLGGDTWVIRCFPALAGALTIVLAGKLTRYLGGGRMAIIWTCTALLMSPAFLRSNTLFQPVSFNQFFWFLSAVLLIRATEGKDGKRWYFLGFIMAVGLLIKYSIAFYILALAIALLLSKHHRHWFRTRYPYIAAGIALCLVLPNLIWQVTHHYPVLIHMRELRETQLSYVDWPYYMLSQFQFHFVFSVLWMAGLVLLFRSRNWRRFRYIAVATVLTVLGIGLLSGKPYYTIGAFTVLFPFGAIYVEQRIRRSWIHATALAALIALSVPILPYALPILKAENMRRYCASMEDVFGMMNRWEDGQQYDLPQDYADMHGWQELSQRVGAVYNALPREKREKCLVYGGSYGHAGAMNHYRQHYGLPEVYSLNGSYQTWAAADIDFTCMILVEEEKQDSSTWFYHSTLVDSIRNEHARDKGFIYFREHPRLDVREAWARAVLERRQQYGFE